MPLKRQKWAEITDRRPTREPYPRKELITRLLKGRCELCASTDDTYVHHVARLMDLTSRMLGNGQVWFGGGYAEKDSPQSEHLAA